MPFLAASKLNDSSDSVWSTDDGQTNQVTGFLRKRMCYVIIFEVNLDKVKRSTLLFMV